jgi:hypothetical protein
MWAAIMASEDESSLNKRSFFHNIAETYTDPGRDPATIM